MRQTILARRALPTVHVAAVIPAFNVGSHLAQVLERMPALVRTIVVVDDASRDDTRAVVERCRKNDARILLLSHESNKGVGGAMVTGFRTALDAGADIIVKIDGDDQMPLWLLPKLIQPLLDGDADYTKGNRFREFRAIRRMPLVRRIGNVLLSFLAKAATGYWHCFDPANGFVAIRGDVLSQIPLGKVDPTYYFETSLLAELYLVGAVVQEVPMSAQYGDETSNLSLSRVIRQFPLRLLRSFLRRIVLKNFLYDFSLQSLHIATGFPLLFGGLLFGGYNWIWYVRHHLAAPSGTVVLAALMIMLGVQFVLAAMGLDLQAVPKEPINRGALPLSNGSRAADSAILESAAQVTLDESGSGAAEIFVRETESALVKKSAHVRS